MSNDNTDTEDGIALVGTEWTVSASEKISTGEYENAQYHTTIEGEIATPAPELDADGRKELKARLLSIHKEAQETVERAAENRIREPGHDDWGVPPNGGAE
jgi:hypothetical protein